MNGLERLRQSGLKTLQNKYREIAHSKNDDTVIIDEQAMIDSKVADTMDELFHKNGYKSFSLGSEYDAYQARILELGRERMERRREQWELEEKNKEEQQKRRTENKPNIEYYINLQYDKISGMIESKKFNPDTSTFTVIDNIFGVLDKESIKGLSEQFNKIIRDYYGYTSSHIESYFKLPGTMKGISECHFILNNEKRMKYEKTKRYNRITGKEVEVTLEYYMSDKVADVYQTFRCNKTVWVNTKALDYMQGNRISRLLLESIPTYQLDNGKATNMPCFQMKLEVLDANNNVINEHVGEFINKVFSVLLMAHIFKNQPFRA